MRRALQVGHRPSVIRMYDEEATRLTFAPVVGEDLSGVYTVLAFEGEAEAAELEERRMLEIAGEAGAEVLDPALGQRWWDRRYDFYHPPHQPELPGDLGHARRRRDVRPRRGGVRRASPRRPRARTATPGSSCGCTSRTGTRGAR